MSTPSPLPPMTNEPGKRTRVRRNLKSVMIIAFFSVLFAIILVRVINHRRETVAERQQREQLAADARKPAASPDAFRAQLEQQQARLRATMADATSAPTAASAVGVNEHPLPAGYRALQPDGDLSDADRLALQRASDDDQSIGLMAYETTDSHTITTVASGSFDDVVNEQKALKQELANSHGGGDAGADLATLPQGMRRGSNTSASAQRAVDWQNGQDADSQGSPLVPVPYQSAYIVEGGTPIPTVILHGANSDMPGTFRAVVDRDIYDSVSMSCKLIPRGTRIVGLSNNDVAIGQERMQLAATKMFFPKSEAFPDGASMRLDGLGSADPDGEAGVSAEVNNHFFKIFGSTFLIAGVAELIGRNQSAGSGTTININGGATNDLRAAAGQSVAQTTQTILQRNANIQPTLLLKPGQPMVFMVKRDLMIPPELISGGCK
ncbi:TrbI/VirB10 family protein [Paraburkholderia humisilvae]